MSETSFEILKGNLVRLRIPEPADIDFILAMENDPDVWRHGDRSEPYSDEEVLKYVLGSHDIFTEKQVRFIIETDLGKEGRKRVGAVDLFNFSTRDRRAGIGILILPDERRKGYALEAIRLICAYGFERVGLHQLHCDIAADNLPSIRLFEKAGFAPCGVKKEWLNLEGKWVDEISYQILNRR